MSISHSVLAKWKEVHCDGVWSRESKTAMQCLIKAKIPQVTMTIDGRFHHHSTRGLQMLLAQEKWYRPGLHNDTTVHQSRVTLHCLALHQWLCALQENLAANAALIFHNITAHMPVQRDMGKLSSRTAVSYFDAIATFVKKSEVGLPPSLRSNRGIKKTCEQIGALTKPHVHAWSWRLFLPIILFLRFLLPSLCDPWEYPPCPLPPRHTLPAPSLLFIPSLPLLLTLSLPLLPGVACCHHRRRE